MLMSNINGSILNILILAVLIQLLVLLWIMIRGIYKYFMIKEINHIQRYGKNTWVIITGGSSGQGKQFALQFAKKGFNILLIGSHRSKIVKSEINLKYPNIKVLCIIKNFCNSYNDDFFTDIENVIKKLNGQISILVNNVAHRTAWIPYHKMPKELIRNTISCGTIVQARLIHMLIPYFLKRKNRSAIINITAQCNHHNIGLGMLFSNDISVPYLSVYEASNAFGYYHSNSIYKEYGDRIDILNITPGAVITENTQYLTKTPFNINSEKFVNNIIKFMGNINGTTCAYWGHALSVYLINIYPFKKDTILHETGEKIAVEYMKNKNKNKNKKY